MTTKHTPGPWEVHEKATHIASGWQFWPIGPKDSPIATASYEDAHSKANAQLIAAAPALLKTIENALVSLAIISMPVIGDPGNVATNEEILKIMGDSFKAAIAAAEAK